MPLARTWVHPLVCGGASVAHLFSFLCCVFMFCFFFVLYLVCPMLLVSLDCLFLIVPSVFSKACFRTGNIFHGTIAFSNM